MDTRPPLDSFLTGNTSPAATRPPLDSFRKGALAPLAADPAPKAPGFFQSLAQGIAKPFLRTAATVVKGVAGLGGLATMGIGHVTKNKTLEAVGSELTKNAASTKPVSAGYFGPITPVGVDPQGKKYKGAQYAKDVAGTGIELGSYALGGGEAAGGIDALKAGGWAAVKEGAKVGAEVGATQGFGVSLQSKAGSTESTGKQVLDVGLNTVLGGTFGAVLGAGTAGLGEAVRLGKNMVRPGEEFVARNEQALVNSYRVSLKLKPTQIKLEDQWMKDTPAFLARESVYNPNVRLKVGPGGTLDADGAIAELQKMAKGENTAFDQILQSENKYVSLEDYRRKALANVDTPAERAKGTEYGQMVDHINREVDALKKNYATREGVLAEGGDLKLPLEMFNEIKQGRWATAKGFMTATDKVYGDTNFRMGQAAKDLIEENLDSADARAINRRLGNIAQAQKILEDRNGVKLAGGRMGRWTAAKIGAIVGLPQGPAGAVTGALTAEKIAEVLQNPEISNGIKRWIITRARQYPDYETVAQQAERILGEKLDDAANRLALPPPREPSGIHKPGDVNVLPAGDVPMAPHSPTTFEAGRPQTVKPPFLQPLALPPGQSQNVSTVPIALPKKFHNQSDYFGPLR